MPASDDHVSVATTSYLPLNFGQRPTESPPSALHGGNPALVWGLGPEFVCRDTANTRGKSLYQLGESERQRGSMAETFLFTSESVNEGHPDKLCDQVHGQRALQLRFASPVHAALARRRLFSDGSTPGCKQADPFCRYPMPSWTPACPRILLQR